ncbi:MULTISPECIES: 4-hydroxy-tetrahydrodipicolinate synthase [Leptospirillum]|uniref:4-hydroxy-tetrahydrodipicolinate synthase n=3 Tax=Leptospirillum ferriphilum TaxID=178606 RepID=A0A059XVR4_9BACT|nr:MULTISPECIES: 4-hydroxy-tetrahydrodipicolinate synthase [Leptospirillum]EAY58219.1 MAG: Dihydrodipicolinate synthase [Leptospirillum rubarum]EIJ76454.1 MAG: Dihydrodipicolinate synthase [Leptospirillum sp. Group II 'C75']AFS54505.1 dihydrodipicolinate synthase/N-acetylneuraminate lyase [Leptospirillum ferriphilum ML-04]AIA31195.1 dihydrodipicolinate synthase [Leptospirillum ferriphilum YSK]AKS24419.1 dihydrodipicolinate synthase [Leptospirillum sp. Group II 'CF-1']
MFKGSMVALVTPFAGGRVDERKLRELVDFHIREGTQALVPVGTTGESATLDHREHERVLEVVIEHAARRIQVLAGTGSNSTDEAIRLTRAASAMGADGALIITPYYNRPTQEGLVRHYEALAKSVDIPMVIYNVPVRTGVNILPETIERLVSIELFVGVKEASGSLSQIIELFDRVGDRMAIYSGDDLLTHPILSIGGKGVISVSANIVPRLMSEMVDEALAGNWDKAFQKHLALVPLHRALGLETNPIPIKTAMGLAGMIAPDMRLPLVPMSEGPRRKLEDVLKTMGLLGKGLS